MKKFALVLALISLYGCNTYNEKFTLVDGVLIENATIISADEFGAIKSYVGHILTDQSNIIFCGKKRPKISGQFKSINGQGKYVIPGLIDSHVHLNNIAGINFRQRQSNKLLVEEYFNRLPKNFLYFGYTTLIDVDNYAPNTIDKIKSMPPGPEIYTCAQKLQIMNDFEMVMNEIPENQRYQSAFLHDTYNRDITYPDSIDLEKHSVFRTVSNAKNGEHICIKTLYEDASSGLPQLWALPTKKLIKELVHEANNQGLKTIMHATSFQGQEFARQTDVTIIAHAMWNWTATPQDFLNTNLPQTHEKLLLDISINQIGYQPTLRTIFGEIDILDNRFKDDKVFQKLYSPDYLEWLQSEEGQWAKYKILSRPKFLKQINPEFYNPIRNQFNSDEEMIETLYASMELKIQKVMQVLSNNNANFLFSTDNGAMNMYTHPPGYNGYLEMQHWVEAGVPLIQIFKAATYNNANTFDLLESIGTLHEGKTANILILKENPLETIEAYNSIEYLLINGELIEREKLAL